MASFGLATTQVVATTDNAKDVEVANPPTDGISAIHWSPVAEFLVASSWDGQVRIWEVTQQGQTIPRAMYNHDGPVLCCRWNKDGTKIASGGADKVVKVFDVQTGQAQAVGQHDGPVKEVRWYEEGGNRVLITGSWDKTVRYWDLRSPQPIGQLQVGDRVYSMDSIGPLLVVATAERKVQVVNLTNPTAIFKTLDSPLKWQVRTISCLPNATGFAMGSIEGRVAIQHIDDKNKAENFSFKCHRDSSQPPNVYAVNSISFHPGYGTFATAGADGGFHFWDKDSRTRLKMFSSAGGGIPISASCFNRTGTLFAYAVSYDWSKGHEHYKQGSANIIKIHPVQDADIKSRPKKR